MRMRAARATGSPPKPSLSDAALGAELPFRQPGEVGAGAPLGVGDQLAGVERHCLRPDAGDQVVDAADPGVVGGDLGAQSPAVSRFERICASTNRNRSGSISPARTSLTAGMITPS